MIRMRPSSSASCAASAPPAAFRERPPTLRASAAAERVSLKLRDGQPIIETRYEYAFLRRECQWPSVSPQWRPSGLPTGGHLFSPWAAIEIPHRERVGA